MIGTREGAAAVETRRVALPTGELAVRVDEAAAPLDRLCGFAARRNPRRGFLFVSRVLGRHVPVRPGRMRWAQARLAARIEPDLPGPVLFLGLAETATGLGQGVHEAWRRRTARADTLFLHSTRYGLEREPLLEFREEHSHAPAHLVYRPASPALGRMLRHVRSVVLVDDEASTGTTFLNLARSLVGVLPALERATTAVLTDWCGEARRGVLRTAMPVPTRMVTLLAGSYVFTPAPGFGAAAPPAAGGSGAAKDALIPRDHGRLGGRVDPARVQAMARRLFRRPGERVLVLGTSEFVHPPYLLAAALERLGADVRFQATTRSPALVGHALGCALQFTDSYGDGFPNWVYNVRREAYDRVLVCHETPEDTLDPVLLAELAADTVAF
ncbi:MAG: phosphoribosyltransferase domain-containing protein [Longimicrobiaceae bacterium]